jgi:hypothetical protein
MLASDDGATGTGSSVRRTRSTGVHMAACAGIVRAFDAADVTQKLQNSETNSGPRLGSRATAPPTIAKREVLVETFDRALTVLDLLPEGALLRPPWVA